MKFMPNTQGQSLTGGKGGNVAPRRYEQPVIPVHFGVLNYALVHLQSSLYLSRSTDMVSPISVELAQPVHDHARQLCASYGDRFKKYTGLCWCQLEEGAPPVESSVSCNYQSLDDSGFHTQLASLQHRIKSEVMRVFQLRHATGPRRKVAVYSELHEKPEEIRKDSLLHQQQQQPLQPSITNNSTPTAGIVGSLGSYLPTTQTLTGLSSYLTGWGGGGSTTNQKTEPVATPNSASTPQYTLNTDTNEHFRVRLEVSVLIPSVNERWTIRLLVSEISSRYLGVPSTSSSGASQLHVEHCNTFVPSSEWNIGRPSLHPSLLQLVNSDTAAKLRSSACSDCHTSPSIEHFTLTMQYLDKVVMHIAKTMPSSDYQPSLTTNAQKKLAIDTLTAILETEYDCIQLDTTLAPPEIPPVQQISSISTVINLDNL